MREVISRGTQNENLKRSSLIYKKTIRTYDLKKNPSISKTTGDPDKNIKPYDVKIYQITNNPKGKAPERLIEEDGMKKNQIEDSGLDIADLYSEIPKRYRFYLQGQEVINDRAYYIIRFESRFLRDKNTNISDDDIIEKGMNRMEGTMHIDVKDFYLSELDGIMVSGFRKFLVINAHGFSIKVWQEVFSGIAVVHKIQVDKNYSVFGVDSYYRSIYEYSDYKDLRQP